MLVEEVILAQLSDFRILICNDDGINSTGIKILERIARDITPDVWVVAPEFEQSGKGMSITFNDILRVNEVSPRKYMVNGTPADCVVMAVNHILTDKKPDLVLTGINHGNNAGDTVFISGTVGAAQIASFHGIRSIAVSQDCYEGVPPKFHLPDHFLPQILKKLVKFHWLGGMVININFPEASIADVKGTVVVPQGAMQIDWNVIERTDPVGYPYYWVRSNWDSKNPSAKTDINYMNDKYITITPIDTNLNNQVFLDELSEFMEL